MTKENIDLFASKLSELNINLSIDNYWLAIILPIIFAGIGAYLGAYFKKSGENRAVNENLENLKIQIEQTTKITEDIKAEISKKNTEHQVKYSIYHQKRIDVVTDLYEMLLDIESKATSYIMKANFEEGETADFNNAKKSILDFLHYANRNMMWVPEELYDKFDGIIKKINDGVFKTFVYVSKMYATKQAVTLSEEKSFEIIQVLSKDVPKVKNDILITIRKILDPSQQ